MLEIDPSYKFNPQIISPKIIEIFDIALEQFKLRQKELLKANHKSMESQRISASLRSLMFPGLGQLYKGEKVKGYIIISAETVSLVGLGLMQWKYIEAHSDYLDASSPSAIADKYREYDTYYKLRNYLAITTVGIYFYSYIDCLYSPIPISQKSFSFSVSPSRLTLFIEF
jgi:hypothetical protein